MKLDESAAKQVINDEVIDHLDEDFYGDFYDFFVNFMKFKELTALLTISLSFFIIYDSFIFLIQYHNI